MGTTLLSLLGIGFLAASVALPHVETIGRAIHTLWRRS